MSLTQYAVELEPKTWTDIRYQDSAVKRLKEWLKTDKHPYAAVFSGPTGTGKTSAVRMYIRSLFCENRADGEVEPCNECPTCKADPRISDFNNSVLWIQKGQDETIGSQFKRAIEEMSRPPSFIDEEHRNYKVIVFDELQNLAKDKLQELLFYPEVPALAAESRVILIFITMAEDQIKEAILKPLRDRSRYVRFNKVSVPNIVKYLESYFQHAPQESLEMIAEHADGSIRSALACMQNCLEIDSYLLPNNTAETLNYVSKSTRDILWCYIKDRNYRGLLNFWRENEGRFDNHRLIVQMMHDLDEAMALQATDAQLQVHCILYQYLMQPNTQVRALDCLKTLMGKNVGLPIIKEEEDAKKKSGYERVMQVIQ